MLAKATNNSIILSLLVCLFAKMVIQDDDKRYILRNLLGKRIVL